MATFEQHPPRDTGPAFHGDQSSRELISEFFEEARHLVKAEVALAKGDLRFEANKAKDGGVWTGTGAYITAAGGLALCACLVLVFATFLSAWLAALVVGGALCLIGAGIARSGVQRMKRANAKRPLDRIQGEREWMTSTVQAAKTARHSGTSQTPHARA